MMATGTDPGLTEPADQSPHELGEDDLRVVFRALHPVAEKYKVLGVEMNMKMTEIKKIQRQCSDPDECLLEVLSVCLKQIPSLTWKDIDTALRSDTVGEPQLADRIRRKYGHLYSPDPSFEASLDKEKGRKKSEMTKNKNQAKKDKPSRKYTQQDSDKSERYRKPSKMVQMNEAVVKKNQQRTKQSPTKRDSKTGKQYIEKESKHKGETQRKKRTTEYDKEREVVCGSRYRHKVKHSEQREQKEMQIESESESSASSSEQEIVQVDNSDSTEESYSSEQEEDSAEEVSETERYQKPSEQPKKDKYPHSHGETPVRKTKGKRRKSSDLEKTKFESQSKPESSYEEEQTEPDDESSPLIIEEEVKKKLVAPSMKERVKETGKRREERVKIAANVPDFPGNEDQSDPNKSWDQEEHDIQPKKRSRRRHRESSMRPTARGSSSPFTSEEENQKLRRKGKQEADPGRKKKKRVKKKKEGRFSSTETDDSSPESEMLRSLSEAETKNLIKVFKCFFGRLCCAIKDPVETAAQLQAKRLISCSTMESLMTSPESEQVKTITLVRSLAKRIKQHPEKIFIISSIFLESELLQEIGRRMLIETGNYNNPFFQ